MKNLNLNHHPQRLAESGGSSGSLLICLLFDQTKSLFQRWLLYGIGTLFSLSVLVVMVDLATRAVGAIAAKFWLQNWAAKIFDWSSSDEGINSMAMQQGGLGLVMSRLMVMAPPMEAMFFGGTLGQFVANSSFGNVGRNSTGQDSDFRQRSVRDNNNDGSPDPWRNTDRGGTAWQGGATNTHAGANKGPE